MIVPIFSIPNFQISSIECNYYSNTFSSTVCNVLIFQIIIILIRGKLIRRPNIIHNRYTYTNETEDQTDKKNEEFSS